MNQAILFNDDHTYIADKKLWHFTGLISGSLINIYMVDLTQTINKEIKFDWEEKVESWLEDNEPDEDNEIWL